MLSLVILSLAVVTASAIVCPPDICNRMDCAAVTAENCVGGKVVQNGGFCGCCDKCVTPLAEGEKCLSTMLLGVPPNTECGESLKCDPSTLTCRKFEDVHVNRRQMLTCAERLQEIQSAQTHGLPLLGQFIPSCDQDGSFSARQCRGSQCYCVDPKGVKIYDYEAHISGAADMDCACARDQYAYKQTGLIGKQFFCTTKGSYMNYTCVGSVCFCADKNGQRVAGSPPVSIGNIRDLRC